MIHLVEVTKANRVDDIYIEYDNLNDALIYLSQNHFASNGYRIICYSSPEITTLRAGSKAQLMSYKESENTTVEYDTIALAQVAIDALADSDGYDLVDLEQPIGSASSILLSRRCSLHRDSSDELANAEVCASRENGHLRTDMDRF